MRYVVPRKPHNYCIPKIRAHQTRKEIKAKMMIMPLAGQNRVRTANNRNAQLNSLCQEEERSKGNNHLANRLVHFYICSFLIYKPNVVACPALHTALKLSIHPPNRSLSYCFPSTQLKGILKTRIGEAKNTSQQRKDWQSNSQGKALASLQLLQWHSILNSSLDMLTTRNWLFKPRKILPYQLDLEIQ